MSAVSISDGEWQVMQAAWDMKRATAAELISRLSPEMGWNHRTVRTLLARLVEKGALAAEADGHRYVYRPRVTRRQCVRAAGVSFLNRVFAGDSAELLIHFARDARLTAEQAAELQQLLEDKRQGEE